jgi:uncharacterized Tic20 family protein
MSDQSTTPNEPSRPSRPSQPDPSLAYEPPAGSEAPGYPTPGSPAYGSPSAGYTPVEPPPAGRHGVPSVPPGPYATAPALTVTAEERNWAMAAHLSGFVAAYLALGFLGPLVVLLTAGNRSAFVRRHAVEALNFNLTVLIAAVVSGIMVIILIGLLMLAVVFLGYVIATIAGTMAASRGEDFRYPLTIHFVH